MKLVFSSIMLAATALFSAQTNAAKPDNEPVEQAEAFELRPLGSSMSNDGSFNYQGFLEFNGAPANGMYSFEFEAFDNPAGPGIIHENFYTSPTVPVVDGLFNVDVQMGGTPEEARRFWREVGDQEMYLEIRVGEFEGGPYTTLGTRSKLGWSARAQYSGISESLRFPYTDSYLNGFGDPATMISLTNEFGGTILDLSVGAESIDPAMIIGGTLQYDDSMLIDRGILQLNDTARSFGLVSIADQFSIIGLGVSPDSSNRAAILGEVLPTANPSIIAVWALNDASGNRAALGTDTYAGDFGGDVLVRNDLRVQGEPTRDYAFGSPSPIGPLAYGSVSFDGSLYSGTANLSSTWDAANERYVISVSGENLRFETHIVSITVVEISGPRLATFVTNGGNLWVKIWDIASGNAAIEDNFSIVIYDANPAVLNRNAAPNGMDEDKYTELTGAKLIQTQPYYEPVEPIENYGSGVTGD